MPALSKEELYKKTVEYKDLFNSSESKFKFNVTNEEILKNIEDHYDDYKEACEFADEQEQAVPLVDNYVAENNVSLAKNNYLRRCHYTWVDPKNPQPGLDKIKEVFVNNQFDKSANQYKYFHNLIKNYDLKEHFQAGESFKGSMKICKEQKDATFLAFALPSINQNIYSPNNTFMPNIKTFNKAVDPWKVVLESSALPSKRVLLASSPMYFMFKDCNVKVPDSFMFDINSFKTKIVQSGVDYIKDIGEHSLDTVCTYFTESSLNSYNVQKKYIEDHNIGKEFYLNKPPHDLSAVETMKQNLEFEKYSEEEVKNMDNVDTLRSISIDDCNKIMKDMYEKSSSKMPSKQNGFREISRMDIGSLLSELHTLSDVHFSRQRPSWWEFIVRTEAAKKYSAERDIMNKYCKALKNVGISQEHIDTLTNRRGPKQIDASVSFHFANQINERFEEKREEFKAENPAPVVNESSAKTEEKSQLIIEEANDSKKVIKENNNANEKAITVEKTNEKEKDNLVK